jgi:hypothetical protein
MPGSSTANHSSGTSKDRNAATAAKHTDTTLRVRVKDVHKYFHDQFLGGPLRIPLAAYREAGVAYSRNDLVSEEDVQAVINYHEARGIAEDIDTQWGAFPGGGVLKESDQYW